MAWLPESLIEEDLHAGSPRRRGGEAIAIEMVLIRAEAALASAAERFWQLAVAAAGSA